MLQGSSWTACSQESSLSRAGSGSSLWPSGVCTSLYEFNLHFVVNFSVWINKLTCIVPCLHKNEVVRFIWTRVLQLIECPSVYELMASEGFRWTDPPELRLWRENTDDKGESGAERAPVLERYGPEDYLQVMSAALRGNTVRHSQRSRLPIGPTCVQMQSVS